MCTVTFYKATFTSIIRGHIYKNITFYLFKYIAYIHRNHLLLLQDHPHFSHDRHMYMFLQICCFRWQGTLTCVARLPTLFSYMVNFTRIVIISLNVWHYDCGNHVNEEGIILNTSIEFHLWKSLIEVPEVFRIWKFATSRCLNDKAIVSLLSNLVT